MAKQTDLASSNLNASATPLARAGSCPMAKQPDLASSHAAASVFRPPAARPGPAAPARARRPCWTRQCHAPDPPARWQSSLTLPAHMPVPSARRPAMALLQLELVTAAARSSAPLTLPRGNGEAD